VRNTKSPGERQTLWGAAGIAGTGTSAAFKQDLIDKIKSGTATPDERFQYANTFGHEMSHLGWEYKPASERINVPGVGEEGGLWSALSQSKGGAGEGEEVWNYMHDLMYAPRSYSQDKFDSDFKNLQNQFASGKIHPDQYRAEGSALIEKLKASPSGIDQGKGWLKSRDYINPGDLSYTPKAHEAIAWSGLTSADKRAIGFGVNPHEATMMGQMRSYPDKLSDEAWLAEADKRYLTASLPNYAKDFIYSTDKDEDDPYVHRIPDRIRGVPRSIPEKMGVLSSLRNRFYRPAVQGAGNYTAAQLNRMNALGGYYSEPAREQRRTQNRIKNMLSRRAQGKTYSAENLKTLSGGQFDFGQGKQDRGHQTPTRSAPAGVSTSSGMHGGKHYAYGGRIDKALGGRSRYL
jgi:hypothetical protein